MKLGKQGSQFLDAFQNSAPKFQTVNSTLKGLKGVRLH